MGVVCGDINSTTVNGVVLDYLKLLKITIFSIKIHGSCFYRPRTVRTKSIVYSIIWHYSLRTSEVSVVQ